MIERKGCRRCSHIYFFFIVNCSQCPERRLLGVGQPTHICDVHSLIWPITSQCMQTYPFLHIPELNCSILATTSKGASIEIEGNGPDPITMPLQRLEAISSVD